MKIGYCALCQEVKIMHFDEKNRLVLSPNYREHFLELSNGTLMRVCVDEECKTRLIGGSEVMKNANIILENHKAFWARESPESIDAQDLEVIDPNTDEEKYRRKKALQTKEENDKLEAQKEDHYRTLEVEEPKRRAMEEKMRRDREESDKKLSEETERETYRKNLSDITI